MNRNALSLCCAATIVCVLASASVSAQKQKREPLTEKQQEEIAEAGIDPVARVDLYVKYLNEHADTIKGLTKRAQSPARGSRIEGELEDFTALMDELSENLDVFAGRKADIRKSMKPLAEGIKQWLEILNALPKERAFGVALDEAIESGNDLDAQAKQIRNDQDAYFKANPGEKGQDRYEPK
jgi:hypothetical protein